MKKPLLLMLASVISLGTEVLALPSVVVLVTVVPTETFARLWVKIFAVVLARYPSGKEKEMLDGEFDKEKSDSVDLTLQLESMFVLEELGFGL